MELFSNGFFGLTNLLSALFYNDSVVVLKKMTDSAVFPVFDGFSRLSPSDHLEPLVPVLIPFIDPLARSVPLGTLALERSIGLLQTLHRCTR
jgi:hypothetical protein